MLLMPDASSGSQNGAIDGHRPSIGSPGLDEALALNQMGFALRWKSTMERVLDMAHQFAQNPDVQAFLLATQN